MSAAPEASLATRLAWGVFVWLAALGAIAAIVVASERSRAEPSVLGQALGIASVQPSLLLAADALTLRGVAPNPAEIARARRFAVAQPLSPLPFYLLGASGHAKASSAAVGAALKRDPRFRPAYRWQAVALAKRGDVGGATRALIRLGVLTPTDGTIWPAIALLAVDPIARRVIKQEIARGATWRDAFLAVLSTSAVDRAIVFEMLQTAGKRADATVRTTLPGQPDDHREFIAAMVARKDYDRAYLAWVEWLPAVSQGATGLVFDGGFKGLAALPPFAWQLSDGVGGATAIEPRTGLTLDYSGTDGAVLARQMVLLAPGRYRLVSAGQFAAVPNDDGVSPLAWDVTCVSDSRSVGGLAVPLDGTARRVGGTPFAVDQACPAQMLTLKVGSLDFTKRVSGHIRSVAIEPVAR